jgi:hypothetical protein
MIDLMQGRREEIEREAGLVEALSPFRAAFAQARLEGRVGSEGAGSPRQAAEKKPKPRNVSRFEVRIEKRRGRRSADASRWNKLGREGWELVAVVGKQAFFRRHARG